MRTRKQAVLLAAMLILGVLFVGIGWQRGEAETVLTKAIHICLECIGIG